MRITNRLLALTILSLAVAACGGSSINAVVGGGSAQLQAPGAEAEAASGPISFPEGAVITAGHDGTLVRVACGATLSDAASTGGDPEAGIVDFDLTDGTQLRRRQGTTFDLIGGVAHIKSGAVLSRLVVFHATSFLEVRTDNGNGIDVHVITQGDQLKVEVVKGRVLLNTTGATEKNLLFVTLEGGETSIAKPGEAPQKNATDWFDTE